MSYFDPEEILERARRGVMMEMYRRRGKGFPSFPVLRPGVETPPGGIQPSDVVFFAGQPRSTCSRCREPLSSSEIPFLAWPAAGDGHLVYRFCERCAHDPESERCRVCGCSENRPCPIGCGWVAPGLCTACVGANFE